MTHPALVIAARIVSHFEGFETHPYQCQAGKWTIGYGTTMIKGQPVTPDTPPVTEAGALLLMQQDLESTLRDVQLAITVPVTNNQLAALISFTYNLGIGNFRRSTMRAKLNRSDYPGAAVEFMNWVFARDPQRGGLVKSGGLVRRREAEQKLFNTPDGEEP